MITRFTKIQLAIFAIVTLVGGTIVGGRYAQIDRLIIDRTYAVTAQLTDSGGIFEGAQVTYRGISVGRVDELRFTPDGVDAVLAIEKSAPAIPTDSLVVVANKSAIGEQFIDLQPRSRQAPFMVDGTTVSTENTRIPLATTDLLISADELVRSIDTENLTTVVHELGQGFEGTNRDLENIVSGTTTFVRDAHAHIGVTRDLIRGAGTVLQTQLDVQSDVGSFARDLAAFSDTLATADGDLERLIDVSGPAAARLENTVAENSDNLSIALDNLNVAARPLMENVAGLQSIFVLYPYLLQGSFTVTAPSDIPGEWDAHFGLVLTTEPHTCTYESDGAASGYRPRRDPAELRSFDFQTDLDCIVPDNDLVRQASKSQLGRTSVDRIPEGDWGWLLLDALN